MISFTDVLHDLVRRGATLRFDPEGHLFIYDPQHTARGGAAKAENASTTAVAVAEGPKTARSGSDAAGGSAKAAARAHAAKPAAVVKEGVAERYAALLASRRRGPATPEAGMPPAGTEWRGISWQDVPGHDESIKKLNFALLKRGMLRGHKCCKRLEGEALKDRLDQLSQRNRENSQVCKEQARLRHKSTPRPKPP